MNKVMRWYWMRDGDVRFEHVTYDGTTATAERADRIQGSSIEQITVDQAAVLVAVTKELERWKRWRSEAAKKATVTKALRKTARFKQVVSILRAQGMLQPRDHCAICGKRLTDSVSKQRGIGPECWTGVTGLLMTAKRLENDAEQSA